jgi:mannosyltransferase
MSSELQPLPRQRETFSTDSRERVFYQFLTALAVLWLWVMPIWSSFWLDETGTYWVIKDGFASAFVRAMDWLNSPLYYLIARLAHLVPGRTEVTLRLPSLIAMMAAAWLMYKLAVRLFDAESALFVVLFFACSEHVAFAAADARPYALALFLLIASTWMLVRWLDSGRLLCAAGYVLLAALTIYTHVFLAIALVAHGIYALYRSRAGVVKPPALLAAWLLAALLSLPLIVRLAFSYRTRGPHSFAGTPTFFDLLAGIAPPVLTASVGLGLLIGWLSIRPQSEGRRVFPSREGMILASGWALVPPAALYLVSILTETKLFLPRYYISATPGLALIAGAWIRALPRGLLRSVVALAVFAAAIRSFGTWQHGDENWAGAMAKVRALNNGGDTPVLMASGFYDAADPGALTVPRMREMLFAPLLLYPIRGTLIRLPFRLDEKSASYLEYIVATDLQNRDRFIFVGRWQGLTFEPWLRGRLVSRGFRSESQGAFGTVGVFLFTREPRADR